MVRVFLVAFGATGAVRVAAAPVAAALVFGGVTLLGVAGRPVRVGAFTVVCALKGTARIAETATKIAALRKPICL